MYYEYFDYQVKQLKCNITLSNSILNTKLASFRTTNKYCHASLHFHFHYPNQHDLLNWTITHSTSKIGH